MRVLKTALCFAVLFGYVIAGSSSDESGDDSSHDSSGGRGRGHNHNHGHGHGHDHGHSHCGESSDQNSDDDSSDESDVDTDGGSNLILSIDRMRGYCSPNAPLVPAENNQLIDLWLGVSLGYYVGKSDNHCLVQRTVRENEKLTFSIIENNNVFTTSAVYEFNGGNYSQTEPVEDVGTLEFYFTPTDESGKPVNDLLYVMDCTPTFETKFWIFLRNTENVEVQNGILKAAGFDDVDLTTCPPITNLP